MGSKTPKKKFLFLVQGEGRGHMTQAISLYHMLVANGHEVCEVVVGKSARRKVPDFFYQKLSGTTIDTIESPNFVTDKSNKSIKMWKTFYANIRRFGIFKRSMKTLHEKVTHHRPDVIVNFYDFLGGIYNRLYRHDCQFVCIAHQYLAAHPDFPFAKGNFWDRYTLKLGNWITAWRADKRLALSFTEAYQSGHGLVVTPPLLRQEVHQIEASNEGFILVYMVNDGYAEEVMKFHRQHPEVRLHCFWDRNEAQETESVDETLTFHQISDTKFLDKMSKCAGYASTAGFESICEAMMLGKPVMMVPVAKQYEQACNAIDAQQAGAGISSEEFDIHKLVQYLQTHQGDPETFRSWVARSESIILPELMHS